MSAITLTVNKAGDIRRWTEPAIAGDLIIEVVFGAGTNPSHPLYDVAKSQRWLVAQQAGCPIVGRD